MIRYSVLTESKDSWVIGRNADTDKYKEKLFSKERLDLHENLFFNVTLPSLRKMDQTKTTVLVFTSEELPDPYITNLQQEVKGDENIKIVKLPRKGRIIGQMNQFLKKELDTFGSDLIYATVRLDDDDALSKDFCSSISKYLNEDFVGYAVSFPTGVAGIYEADNYKSFYKIYQPKIALGLSFINSYKKSRKKMDYVSVYSLGNHTKVDEKHPLILDSAKVMYVRTVHGQSDAYSKVLNKKVVSGIPLDSDFSLFSF